MKKIRACEHCQFWGRSPQGECPIHPQGVEGNSCLDFRLHAELERQGATCYDGELMLPSKRRLSRAQQWKILETHPFFTKKCPKCEYDFEPHGWSRKSWDCPSCGWREKELYPNED